MRLVRMIVRVRCRCRCILICIGCDVGYSCRWIISDEL